MKKSTKYFSFIIIVFALTCFLLNGAAWMRSSSNNGNIDDYHFLERQQEKHWNTEMKQFCKQVRKKIEQESRSTRITSSNTELRQSENKNSVIPYFYSMWRSYPKLTRRLSSCDHQLYMKLLQTIDDLFQQHRIQYIISDGTLLGTFIMD